MTTFIIGSVVLAAIALLFLVPPLLGRVRVLDLDRDAQNVSIAKDRLGELKADFEAGSITAEELEEGKAELETSLATDLDEKESDPLAGAKGSPLVAGIVAVLTLGFSVGMYAYLGSPEGMEIAGPGKPQARPAAHAPTGDQQQMPSIDEMVAKLAAKMEEEPNNADGWFMLGRSYGVLERWQDSIDAYRKAMALAPDQPQIMINLAQAIAAISPDGLAGEPEELFKKALQLDGSNIQALWFSGLAAVDREDYAGAATTWKQILPHLGDDPEGKKELERTIAEVEAQSRGEVLPVETKVAVKPEVKVSVTLADSVKADVAANDLVFIFARAVSGPPMPLAVSRVTVADLPITVTLDDSMAMMPQLAISQFPEVEIQARVSLSGQPTANAGDYQSAATVAAVGDSVSVQIASKVE